MKFFSQSLESVFFFLFKHCQLQGGDRPTVHWFDSHRVAGVTFVVGAVQHCHKHLPPLGSPTVPCQPPRFPQQISKVIFAPVTFGAHFARGAFLQTHQDVQKIPPIHSLLGGELHVFIF